MSKKRPSRIPWSEVSGGDVSLDELVVTRGDRGLDWQEGEMNSRELREKIERVRAELDSDLPSRLPDKGAKLRANLLQLEQELLGREKLSGIQSQEEKMPGISPVAPPVSEDLRCTTPEPKSSARNRTSRIKRDYDHSLLESRSTAITNDRKADDSDHKKTATAKLLKQTSGGGGRMSTRSSKRSCKGPLHQKSDEIQEVVLLDEDTGPSKMEEGNEQNRKAAKIFYPSRDDPECVEISFRDMECLNPESYLSSTIMNFYIRHLQKPVAETSMSRREYHFFNTYFYRKLEEAVHCKVDRSKAFAKLRRWLKGVKIFQKAYLFLPIHGDSHWSLVIICIPAKEDESGPIILHLDSLGFHDSNTIFKNIESYLNEEWRHASENDSSTDIPIPEKIWNHLPRNIKRKKIMVPQQKNDYDCGLFVLYFIKRFIEEAPERVRRKDLEMFGNKWFQPEEASALRKKLNELLMQEFERDGLEDEGTEFLATSSSCVGLKLTNDST